MCFLAYFFFAALFSLIRFVCLFLFYLISVSFFLYIFLFSNVRTSKGMDLSGWGETWRNWGRRNNNQNMLNKKSISNK